MKQLKYFSSGTDSTIREFLEEKKFKKEDIFKIIGLSKWIAIFYWENIIEEEDLVICQKCGFKAPQNEKYQSSFCPECGGEYK